MNELTKKIRYYFSATYHRKNTDKLLEKHKSLYQGTVLDIGGRDRGMFKKPKDKVEKWIFADIEEKHNPDIVLDIANMPQIESNSIDVINALSLFEHVEKPYQGLQESNRVLKPNGKLIISAPFLYPIHSDPFDFERWSKDKWLSELKNNNFKIEEFYIQGRYFNVIFDFTKMVIISLPKVIKYPILLLSPLFDIFVSLDNLKIVKKSKTGNFHSGYFIIASK